MKFSGAVARVLVALLLISSCGCAAGSGSDALMRDDHATEITVKLCTPSTAVVTASASAFERKTGVHVNVENYFDPEKEGFGYAQYWEQAKTELMSGRGADIYSLSGINFSYMGKNGLLCDFSNAVATDPDMSDAVIFQNVLTAAATEDGLYGIPMDFSVYTLLAAPSTPLIGGEWMTWDAFFDATKDLPRKGTVLSLNDRTYFLRMFSDNRDAFVDVKGRSVDVYALRDLLTRLAAWREQGYIVDSRASGDQESLFLDINMAGEGSVAALCGYPTANAFGYMEYRPPVEDTSAPIPLSSTTMLGINMGSQCKGTAYAFLKYMLSAEAEEDLLVTGSIYLPLNRAVFREMAERQLEKVKRGNAAVNVEADAEALMQLFDADFDGLQHYAVLTMSGGIEQTVYEIAREYFLDELTEEAALEKMQERIELYLKEQG